MEGVYKYRAVDANGKTVLGELQASSKEAAVQTIKARKQVPLEIKEPIAQSLDLATLPMFKPKVKVAHLSVFCRQLSAMLNSGMPINRALDIQESQTENKTLKEAVKEISNAVKRGETLSKAMRMYPDIFPQILLSMIESGEATGKLDEVLERMSVHYVKENKINNKVKGAMVYPMVLAILCVVVVIGMMIGVVPMFVEMLTSSGMELPLITKITIGISNSIRNFWYIYVIVVVGTVQFSKRYLKTPRGKMQFDHFKLNFYTLKKPMSQIVTARFTRTMATLLESGVPIVRALIISGETTNNVIVQEALNVAADGIKRGLSLAAELKKTELFPMMMISMVGIGEETGAIDDLLLKTADYYDEELDAGISRLLAMIEPAMIIFMAVIIGFIVVSIMVPMFMLSTASPV